MLSCQQEFSYKFIYSKLWQYAYQFLYIYITRALIFQLFCPTLSFNFNYECSRYLKLTKSNLFSDIPLPLVTFMSWHVSYLSGPLGALLHLLLSICYVLVSGRHFGMCYSIAGETYTLDRFQTNWLPRVERPRSRWLAVGKWRHTLSKHYFISL